jgi:hypothetical protein
LCFGVVGDVLCCWSLMRVTGDQVRRLDAQRDGPSP